jgi:MFS family permease
MVIRSRTLPGFVRYWTAGTVSGAGSAVTTVALQVLVVSTLHATATEVGLVNAARWLPYLLFGLLVGVLVDRRARRPVLVVTDLGRGLLLGVIPLLALDHRLSVLAVAALMVVFGALSLAHDAADQSFLPRLVPPTALTRANMRVQQSSSVATTAGPLAAGGIVAVLGAPLAVLVDAASYLVSAALIGTLRHTNRPDTAGRGADRQVWRELRDGFRWVYRHPTLGPLAVTGHVWFVFNSMVNTVFVPYALDGLRLGAVGLGAAYACAGVGGLLGAALCERLGHRFGLGRTVIVSQWLFPVAFGLIALARGPAALVLVGAGQFVFGVGLGLGSPLEMAFRQALTPDELLGRTNATIRSFNWGVITVGAPLGGVLADHFGYRPALLVGIIGVAGAAAALHLSRFRGVTMPD